MTNMSDPLETLKPEITRLHFVLESWLHPAAAQRTERKGARTELGLNEQLLPVVVVRRNATSGEEGDGGAGGNVESKDGF